MMAYVVARRCRRAVVLSYFGERQTRACCDACDNCLRR
jgi:superfamily II DNA helicase RecQ